MAVKVINYKYGSLTLDIYAKVTGIWGDKRRGWAASIQPYLSKEDADSNNNMFEALSTVIYFPYIEDINPFLGAYIAYKQHKIDEGYVVEDV